MSLKTIKDYEEQRNKQAAGMRSVMFYAMGLLFIALGAVVIYRYKEDTTYVTLGALIILYGIWRIYKGYRRNKAG